MLFDENQTFVDLTLPGAGQREPVNQTALTLWIITHTEREALRYLVVPMYLEVEMTGATTECTTIRNLLGHASLVTARFEALRTMYPHASVIGFSRGNR